MVKIKAPAKINLTLEVLGKRPDGFHEVRSVIQAIDLCDKLQFEVGQGISFQCDMKGWNAGESLVSRAVALVREITGCSEGVIIKIEKRIPLMSGLGGDSSDAAAVLRGLNELWGLNLSPKDLWELAGRLGSDVAFFLHGGTALVEGRGELITPLPSLGGIWVVLVVPDVPGEPGKTRRMYQSLTTSHYTDGKITEGLVDLIKSGGEFDTSMLFNTFENIVFDDVNIRRVYIGHLLKLGGPRVHLAGSGPALFTMFRDGAQAKDLYTRFKNQGMSAYLAATV
jgi:4-diphosphocytidyl-2-C-methyl-D-erythritol kinase